MSTTINSFEGLEVFYSYSHKDEKLQKKLDSHLEALKREGLITSWYDRNINAGLEWEKEIDVHLNKAQIILLLVSSDFVASKYCYSKEMIRALERHNKGEARVIPIILRPVAWENTPFGKLHALPNNGKPITGRGWHNLDEAFLEVTKGIQEVIKELNEQQNSFKRDIKSLITSLEYPTREAEKHILIVDDEDYIAQMLRFFFLSKGFKVTTVNDGSDALEIINHISPDLIVLDIAMPVLGGFEVIRKLRTDNNHVPIFVLSAASYIPRMQEADLQVTAVFSKPLSPREFVKEVEAFFENPTLFTEKVLEKRKE